MRAHLSAQRLLLAAAVFAVMVLMPASASAISGTKPVVVVLCNFSNQTAQPNTVSYYEHMFSDAGNGELGLFDYWRDVSYGNLSVSGTVVKGWYTLSITRDEWVALSRNDKWIKCAEKAKPDVNYSNYQDAIVVFPEAETTTAAALNATDTTIAMAGTTNFPTPPFKTSIDDGTDTTGDGNSDNGEVVNVTAISGNTFTIQRGQGGTTAKAHNNGANVQVPGDLFGFGPRPANLAGTTYTLGGVVGAHHIGLSVFGHEMGHGFGINHSRKQSTSTTDYSDCYDIMSAISCIYAFDSSAGGAAGTPFGGSSFGGFSKGPGLNAVQLDLNAWLPGGRIATFDNSSCSQGSYTMAALNHPEVAGNQELRLPAVLTLPTPGNTTTNTQYYTVELRSKSMWDRGIPNDAFVLHLKGADNVSYWVDAAGTNGGMRVGEEFVDAAQKTYVAVNSINAAGFAGQITLGGCKINADLTYTGPATGDFSDPVTLAGDLLVRGSSAPVPNKSVTLSLGSQSCTDTTNAAGHVSCSVTINQAPGTVTATGSFAGSAAYNAASDPDTNNFTIDKEDSQLTYSGATAADYHDVFTATATLSDGDDPTAAIAGRTVSFELGSGDTCSDTTDSDGVATCSITPTQVPGAYTLTASFAGDTYYKSSTASPPFTITKEETTLTFSGPTVILAGSSGARMTATLIEDGANDGAGEPNVPAAPSPSGQTITFTLGGQSCSDTTDADGNADCTISSVSSASLGSNTVATTFAGDDYYLASSDSDAVIVFAFPSRGAFVLGNNTVSAATTTTPVTWWSDSWWQLNSLSGGAAPLSFKGFAGTVTLPTRSPANLCGTRFTTGSGNSPPQTTGVPSYMGVLVASSVTKKGTTISGTWAKVVVVRVSPGYAPSPGHPGTGNIVATFCG
jgi:hypothetical protein